MLSYDNLPKWGVRVPLQIALWSLAAGTFSYLIWFWLGNYS